MDKFLKVNISIEIPSAVRHMENIHGCSRLMKQFVLHPTSIVVINLQ